MVTKKSKSTAKTKTAKKPIKAVKATKAPSKSPRAKVSSKVEPYHPIFGVVLLIVCSIMASVLLVAATKNIIQVFYKDSDYFAGEYTKVGTENVFKYKNAEETINILEHGTGVVFMGFPSCPWCQAYAPMLNNLAKENGITEISYFNIEKDRENNTENYQKIVSILSDRLQYDKDGNRRVYVPEVVFVIDGEIIGNDHETSKDTLGLDNPEEYWTDEYVEAWKERVGALMAKVKAAEGCTTSCNE